MLNGVNSRILRDDSAPSQYYLADENYWKIELSGDTWTVWDKEGTKYGLGKDEASRATFPQFHCNPISVDNVTWRFMLTEVENKFNKKLTYTYTKKDPKAVSNPCDLNAEDEEVDLAIYPATITYPNDRYQIEFDIDDDLGDPLRGDYHDVWDERITAFSSTNTD